MNWVEAIVNGEDSEPSGVWASGKILVECRENLKGVIKGRIALRLRLGWPYSPAIGHSMEISSRMEVVVKARKRLMERNG